MTYGVIYRAINTENGKVYIGQTTKSLFMRRKQHMLRVKYGDRRTAFQTALLNEGWENFEWKAIGIAESQEELDRKEKHWIAHYKSDDPRYGYNGTDGGLNGTPTAETRQKISEARRGQAVPKEVRCKISKTMKGRTKSEETRQRMSEANKGKRHTAESRQKMSMAKKGKTTWNKGKKGVSEETRKRLSISHLGQNIGEKHPRATISEATVSLIKTDLQNGIRICKVAKKYEVSISTIKNIKYGNSWGWVNASA
jgi:group I intron endonuclease